MRMKAAAWILVALALTGCATSAERARYAQADAALRQNPAFVQAYNACVKSDGFDRSGASLFGFNVGAGGAFFDCMERAGWIQSPRHHPAAIGRYERRP